MRAEAQALAREIELAERRLRRIASERRAWNERAGSAAAQIATIEARLAETKRRARRPRRRPGGIRRQAPRADRRDRGRRDGRRAAADALAAGENALAEADRAARAALEALRRAREDAARAEERFEGAKRRLADLAARNPRDARGRAGRPWPGSPASSPTTPLPDIAEHRGRAGQAAARPRAARRGQSARRGGTARGRDPAHHPRPPSATISSRRSSGCARASRASTARRASACWPRSRWSTRHFKRLFTELFGGGTAELQLIESDDPLEAGLEILAKPPGKKPATLSLLSGGEQALTAMALIFAVFLTNPAPICVLDEVDAPLDDHNVDRFCDLLDEMRTSTDTRFVIITHNPITMARMNRLFGVTMAERGVSQLVSVDLDDAVKILDQQVA